MVTFPFAFDDRFRLPLLLVAGATPDNSHVVVDDDGLVARFGWFRVASPWDNVRDVRVTRDYAAVKAIGPRLSLADRGATFGTNTRAGVCVCFHRPVAALTPVAMHPGLTVTVADVDGLADAVRARMP